MSHSGNLVDWLQAMHQLKPGDLETQDAITSALGLQVRDPGVVVKGTPARPAQRPREQDSEPDAAPEIKPASEAQNRPRRRVESVLTPANASRNPAPSWLRTAQPLETTASRHLRPAIPLDPLFRSRATRAILSGALATPSHAGPLDIAKVIELVSRAQTVDRVPCLSVPTLVRGVQLLIDRSEAMQPFAGDQALLRSALLSVVGRDQTELLYFDATPLRGAGAGPRDQWSVYRPPRAATPVVVLTDLGIGQPPGIAGLADAAEWAEFAQLVSRARCPLLAFVPYPPRRWPFALSRKLTLVQWDRGTTAAIVRRIAGAGLRVREGS